MIQDVNNYTNPYSATVAIIDGSPRKQSSTRLLVTVVAEHLKIAGANVRIFRQDVSPLPLFNDEPNSEQHEAVQELYNILDGADAVVLSSPEYHNSVSGALKNALDWLSRIPDNRLKPMLLCGLIGGGGAMGSSGALLQMMMAVRSLKWWLMPDVMISVPDIWDAFDDGKPKSTELTQRIEQFSNDLVKYSVAFDRIRAAD